MIELFEQRLGDAFTANTIMTPREELMCWEQGADLPAFCQRAREEHYDLAPVTEAGRIVGVLHVYDAETEPLTDRWLVSHDTGIADLLVLFSAGECPGFLTLGRQEVIGLVTPADLNKPPSRVYFYHLIGAIEIALGAWVQRRFKGQPHEILALLSQNRREELMEQQQMLVEGNVDI